MSEQRLSKLQRIIARWLKASGLFFGLRPFSFSQATSKSLDEIGLGPQGERMAADFLKKKGYRIVAAGYRQRLGEIDLIAVDGRCIVFVEVKTWKSDSDQDPSSAVDRSKQQKLTRAGLIYLKENRLLEMQARFDVVSIVWDGQASSVPKIRHFPHAFEAVGHGQLFN
jgi:putative endonuclease